MHETLAFLLGLFGDKQVIGALAGALLGAVVGGVITYAVGEHTRKKSIEQTEIQYIRDKLKRNMTALDAAENNLHNLLITVLKNMGHNRDMAQGIYDEDINITRFSMNMPQPYPIQVGLSDNMLNVQAVTQWTSLETEVMLHNLNTNEFNDYYNYLRTSVHGAQLTDPESLNVEAIKSDNQTISKGAADNLKACEFLRERCIKVLAIINLQSVQFKIIDYSKVTLPEMRRHLTKAVNHKLTDAQIEKKASSLSQDYTEEKAFGANIRS